MVAMPRRPEVSFVTKGTRHLHRGSHIIVNQAYVQYIPPVLSEQESRIGDEPPILFIHGGGLTGSMWEATPDRRPGWAIMASRPPYSRPVYSIDAVDSGRSQRCPDDARSLSTASEHRNAAELWQRFRFGPLGNYSEDDPSSSRTFPDSQFPIGAYDSLNALQSARRRGDEQNLAEAGALRDALVEIGSCDVIAHSNGCSVAMLALQNEDIRRSVREFVMIEPAMPVSSIEHIYGMNCLVVFGDYIEGHAMWGKIREVYARLEQEIGESNIWSLPAMGIKGNSHFPMLDRNSDEVLALIFQWLSP